METILFLGFCVIIWAAIRLSGLYFDDEIRRRAGVKPKSGNADLD
jgi:hypothetical protein